MNDGQMNIFGEIEEMKQPISRELLAGQIFEVLQNITLEQFVGLLTNEFNEVIQYAGLSHGEKTCQKTSLLFNPHRLATRTKHSKMSVYEAIRNREFMSGLARALLFKKGRVNELLYQVIQLGVNGVQYVNEFPPHVAVELCRQYRVKPSDYVLDPCAGWGGRMIGVSVVANNYIGYEPATRTFNGLKNMAGFIRKMNPDFYAAIRHQPFEDSTCRIRNMNLFSDAPPDTLPANTFDFALTSPPYYDTEIYSDEPTNSLNRYPTFEKWCDGFYLPMIQKTMDALKPGKTFVLNIGSRKYPLNKIMIGCFGGRYNISRLSSKLSGTAGLGKDGEGETFYAIRKA